MKYQGCVTDISWKQAVMEKYPDRRPGSGDALRRSRLSAEKRDIPELATQACLHEARRVQDIPIGSMIKDIIILTDDEKQKAEEQFS